MPRAKRHRGNEISITALEFHQEFNQEENNADEFESDKHVVIRRGSKVELEVTFSRPLSEDSFEVDLHRGYRTSYRRLTHFVAKLGEKASEPYQLEIKEVATNGTKYRYSISFPADFPVGSYRVVLEVRPEGSRDRSSWEAGQELVVLFNPWCKDDSVFIADPAHREEYIMNETGMIWAGTHNSMFVWPWNFGQFETVALEAVLYMLDFFDGIDSDGRRDPIHVTRALTEMVNCNDSDGGILFGLWSDKDEDYADGTDPTAWSGSQAILEEYMATKRPVRYAQCWVFGGTLTTVLRTVGIPARPITNFESAHDADANRAIDYYFDLKDRPVEDMSGDSIWNYHVWVEAWMSRPDLGASYGGWQAVDSTPQELSPHTRTMVVGPASTVAIKDGQDLSYDNEFVISEVNADIKYHYEVEKGKFEHAGSNTRKVGKKISTKAVGRFSREDITGHYKYPEGTVAERAALGGGEEKEGDVSFDVDFSTDASIGDNFAIIVKATSTSKAKRTASIRLVVHSVSYTGVSRKEVIKFTRQMELKKGSDQDTMPVPAAKYMDDLTDQALLSVTILALVKETGQSWVEKIPYRLKRPDLAITVDGKEASEDKVVDVTGGRKYTVKAKFTNPLRKSLTNVVFHVEGAKLTPNLKIPGKSVQAGRVAEVSFQISPRKVRKRAMQRSLIITCQSKELKGVMGTASIRVKP